MVGPDPRWRAEGPLRDMGLSTRPPTNKERRQKKRLAGKLKGQRLEDALKLKKLDNLWFRYDLISRSYALAIAQTRTRDEWFELNEGIKSVFPWWLRYPIVDMVRGRAWKIYNKAKKDVTK